MNDRYLTNIELLICAKTWHFQRMLCLESVGDLYTNLLLTQAFQRVWKCLCVGERGQGLRVDLLTPKGPDPRFQDSIKGQ